MKTTKPLAILIAVCALFVSSSTTLRATVLASYSTSIDAGTSGTLNGISFSLEDISANNSTDHSTLFSGLTVTSSLVNYSFEATSNTANFSTFATLLTNGVDDEVIFFAPATDFGSDEAHVFGSSPDLKGDTIESIVFTPTTVSYSTSDNFSTYDLSFRIDVMGAPAAVPEPSTWATMLSSAALLCLTLHRCAARV